MDKLMSAKHVRTEIIKDVAKKVTGFKNSGIIPKIALFRVGENPDDISYELGIEKKFKEYGIEVCKYVFDESVKNRELKTAIISASKDALVHGILIFQPLPSHLDYNELRNLINPNKDVEGICDYNLAGLVTNSYIHSYCAPMAIMKFLEFYKIDVSGKHVVVLGRGATVGKPIALMLIHAHATVSICNSKTKNLKAITKGADIIISAMGKKHMIDADYISADQVVIDAGTIYEGGKLYGDVNVSAILDRVKLVTPTPDGISSLTTDILALNLLSGILDK